MSRYIKAFLVACAIAIGSPLAKAAVVKPKISDVLRLDSNALAKTIFDGSRAETNDIGTENAIASPVFVIPKGTMGPIPVGNAVYGWIPDPDGSTPSDVIKISLSSRNATQDNFSAVLFSDNPVGDPNDPSSSAAQFNYGVKNGVKLPNEDATLQDLTAALFPTVAMPRIEIFAASDTETMSVVPLPAAAWAGLVLMAGLAVTRVVRRVCC